MPFVAMGLLLVGKAALLRGIKKVFALSSDEQMVRPHAQPVVTGMTDNPASIRLFKWAFVWSSR
jgi:hypothetical protein